LVSGEATLSQPQFSLDAESPTLLHQNPKKILQSQRLPIFSCEIERIRNTNCQAKLHVANAVGQFCFHLLRGFAMSRISTMLAVFALTALVPFIAVADHPEDSKMKKCAQVCSACQIECDSCFKHCLELVANGKTEHKATAQLCIDCAECCKACSTLCARNSPLSKNMLECCAKCCEECAEACEKFPNDEHMVACAKSCRDCAKHCSDMSKHDHK
jgi:hypothetical protein